MRTDSYKKTAELDLQHFIDVAAAQKGQTHDLKFQSASRWGEKAGTFTIEDFEPEDPHFFYDRYDRDPASNNDEPTGAKLGSFTIRLNGTKLYKNRVVRCEVHAYVQTKKDGVNDMLCILTMDQIAGKYLKAYDFPILNWVD